MESIGTPCKYIDKFCNRENMIFALYIIYLVVLVPIKMDKAYYLREILTEKLGS